MSKFLSFFTQSPKESGKTESFSRTNIYGILTDRMRFKKKVIIPILVSNLSSFL